MAISTPFCNLISLFSSIKYDAEYEYSFWNEIYGCVNYLNLPYETVMNLPVYIRKFWIKRHNRQAEEEERESASAKDGKSIGGEQLNGFARVEQGKSDVMKMIEKGGM